MISWLVPLVVVVLVAATDAWVYLDARRRAADGSPVYLRVRGFSLDTPVAWLLGCLVLWIFIFPTYLVSRSQQ